MIRKYSSVSIIRYKLNRKVAGLPKMSDNAEMPRETGVGKFLNPSIRYSGSYMELTEQ
jgi:hypothetical protein